MNVKILYFEQPIGEFALGVMNAKDVLSISRIDTLEFDQISLDTKGGPQREPSSKRISEIASYAATPDATFPTPILLAIDEGKYSVQDNVLSIESENNIASIVDGQHRIKGIEKSGKSADFMLPVVFILGATEEEKALIFAIINGKQTRVSASVIFELYKVIEGRNPYKTAHEIARAFNSDEVSPYYRRLKMLGKKISNSDEVLSQGTFVTQLLKNISSDPGTDFNLARAGKQMPPRQNCVFNDYFIKERDDIILKVLLNIFRAVKDTFPDEWEDSNTYNLSKTTGYTGVMKAMKDLVDYGKSKNSMKYETYLIVFEKVKELMTIRELRFVNQNFSSNNTGESKFRDLIIEAIKLLS